MAQSAIADESPPGERSDTRSGIALLLGHRFGDGLVYFRDEGERELFNVAVEWGLLSREGYLTSEGHTFLATHGDD